MNDDFSKALSDTCSELFTAYGVEVTVGGDNVPCSVAGIIGFVGAGLRGNVIIATVAGVSAASRPIPAANDVELVDWVGELANQLLGRVKNHYFLARGIDIQMAAPVTVTGQALECLAGKAPAMNFSTSAGPIVIWSELRLDEGFFIGPPIETESCATEGALEFF